MLHVNFLEEVMVIEIKNEAKQVMQQE